MVRPESKTHEAGELTMSLDTRGSSEYSSSPANLPTPAALRYASFISSTLGVARSVATKSVIDTSGIGTRRARPSRCPATLGITSPVARAAPVVVGTMLMAAPRARRGSLWSASTRFWSSV